MLIKKTTPQEEILNIIKNCKECKDTCEYTSQPLLQDDFKKISSYLGINEEELKKKYLEKVEIFGTVTYKPKTQKNYKKPHGTCIFFLKNECILQENKPTGCKIKKHCTIHGNDLRVWFDINYFLNKESLNSILDYLNYIKLGGHIIPGCKPEEIFDKETLEKIKEYENYLHAQSQSI